MEKLIVLKDKKIKDAICKSFKLKKPSISLALNFKQNTENDVRIRIAAMKNGGKLMCEVKDWSYELLK